MIVASTTDQDTGREGLLIAIPFDEMKLAVEHGVTITHDDGKHVPIVVLFGPSHDALLATIKQNAHSVEGEENL